VPAAASVGAVASRAPRTTAILSLGRSIRAAHALQEEYLWAGRSLRRFRRRCSRFSYTVIVDGRESARGARVSGAAYFSKRPFATNRLTAASRSAPAHSRIETLLSNYDAAATLLQVGGQHRST
jgi:hypothetical protein